MLWEGIPNNLYLELTLYEAASLYPPGALASNLSLILGSAEESLRSLYLEPFHAAEFVDPLLSDAKPSLWTSICQDARLMRHLLAVFLRYEYQYTAVFHKDHFLVDMIAQRHEYCSSLLVNIMLGYACVGTALSADRMHHQWLWYWRFQGLFSSDFAPSRVLEPENALVQLPSRG